MGISWFYSGYVVDDTGILVDIPSGNRSHSYRKPLFVIGKASVNGPFSVAMLNYQRVTERIPFLCAYTRRKLQKLHGQ